MKNRRNQGSTQEADSTITNSDSRENFSITTQSRSQQSDLRLHYSQGRCRRSLRAIVERPAQRLSFTRARQPGRGRSSPNGTDGARVGASARSRQPVMEGKSVLFKKFAGSTVSDIEVEQARSNEVGRGDCRPRAHVRRNHPRGHQGAGRSSSNAKCAGMKFPCSMMTSTAPTIIVGAACINGLQVVGEGIKKIKWWSARGAAALLRGETADRFLGYRENVC